MAKDTEKLIRQLSLISFLMAERRPITALEIKQEVEGYSGMNDDAFARRFYADRAELESLGIELKVDKPAEGYYEAENYSLPPENFYLPPIEFTDSELGALRMALTLLDGEFAYAEPLRLALQQLSWGKPSPLSAPEQRSVALAVTAAAGGRELSQRLSKIETAIFRRKTIVFDYYTLGRDDVGSRKVDPYHLLFRGGQFYLVGHSHERDDVRVFRLSRIRGKVGYASKAEHDFPPPEGFDPRVYATRTDWQLGDPDGTARIWISNKIDWLVERHFGHAGSIAAAPEGHKRDKRELLASLQLTDTELREDIDVLNVVNFGGGSYVLYAEVHGDEIEVDPEPYGDNFAKPARLLPLEAKALVAAIDLFGDHLPQSGLDSVRKKIVTALGHDPSEEGLEIAASGGDDSDVARMVNKANEAQRAR